MEACALQSHEGCAWRILLAYNSRLTACRKLNLASSTTEGVFQSIRQERKATCSLPRVLQWRHAKNYTHV